MKSDVKPRNLLIFYDRGCFLCLLPLKQSTESISTGFFHHLLDYQGKQVMLMSDFETLTIVLGIIGLLITVYKLGKSNR